MEQWPTRRTEFKHDGESQQKSDDALTSDQAERSVEPDGPSNADRSMTSTVESSISQADILANHLHIANLKREIVEAQSRLRDAQVQLRHREKPLAFQKALELYQEGNKIEIDEENSDGGSLAIRYSNGGLKGARTSLIVRILIDDLTGDLDASRASVVQPGEITPDMLISNKQAIEYGDVLRDLNINDRDDRWDILKDLLDLSRGI